MQGVGAFDQSERGGDALRVLEVEGDAAAAPVQDVRARLVGDRVLHGARAIEAQHVGAHVRQHHGREGPGPDAGELEDLDSTEGSHGSLLRRLAGQPGY